MYIICIILCIYDPSLHKSELNEILGKIEP